MTTVARIVGAGVDRVDGREKVSGTALYAIEHPAKNAIHAVAVPSTVASGTIRSVDASAALAVEGVRAVISYENAPRLQRAADAELHVFQSPEIGYRGQFVAGVAAESLEAAQEAARLVRFDVAERSPDVVLTGEREDFYAPSGVGPLGMYATETAAGDFDGAFAGAPVQLDETYSTPAEHHNPMEPHATLALWEGDELTLYESTQGAHFTQAAVAQTFGLDPSNVRVIAQHVGGGFGSKVAGPGTIAAALLAKVVGRPVKFMVTRQQMFAVTGYRSPTISRIRLGAGADGRLRAFAHDVLAQSSRANEFTEPAAVDTRVMYAAPNRLTTHRLIRLDVPSPLTMRAPGTAPGMYALESAIDELASYLDIDPIELRIRNEPEVEPERRLQWSSRHLVDCLREGAERFGWSGRAPRREGDWLVGTGVASAIYPSHLSPSRATIRLEPDETYTVLIDATDIGTGARTVLSQIAADALQTPLDRVTIEIGDTVLPLAWIAGASAGTASWGTAIVLAAEKLRHEGGIKVSVDTGDFVGARPELAYHAFGAQFVEARINVDSGEVRVPRALGVFAAGQIMNAKTARSQLIGGMTWGISMALHEESIMDPQFGDFVNHDLVGYHIATHADIGEIDAICIDERDQDVNPLGAKGVGEIGIVGIAAAVANAVNNATGVRVRSLPIRLDQLVDQLRPNVPGTHSHGS